MSIRGIHPFITTKETLLILNLLEHEMKSINSHDTQSRYNQSLQKLHAKLGGELIRLNAMHIRKEFPDHEPTK